MVEAYKIKNEIYTRVEETIGVLNTIPIIQNKPKKEYIDKLNLSLNNFQFIYRDLKIEINNIRENFSSLAQKMIQIRNEERKELRNIKSLVNSYVKEERKIKTRTTERINELNNRELQNVQLALQRYKKSFEKFNSMNKILLGKIIDLSPDIFRIISSSLNNIEKLFNQINNPKIISETILLLGEDLSTFYKNNKFSKTLNEIDNELDKIIIINIDLKT